MRGEVRINQGQLSGIREGHPERTWVILSEAKDLSGFGGDPSLRSG